MSKGNVNSKNLKIKILLNWVSLAHGRLRAHAGHPSNIKIWHRPDWKLFSKMSWESVFLPHGRLRWFPAIRFQISALISIFQCCLSRNLGPPAPPEESKIPNLHERGGGAWDSSGARGFDCWSLKESGEIETDPKQPRGISQEPAGIRTNLGKSTGIQVSSFWRLKFAKCGAQKIVFEPLFLEQRTTFFRKKRRKIRRPKMVKPFDHFWYL